MEWFHTDNVYPCKKYEQVRVLMYSKEWSTYVDGLYDRTGDKPKWFCYDPDRDKFYDWIEPDWFMRVKLPGR